MLVARSPSGQAAAWPVVETVQTDGICTEVLAPAPGLDPALAADGHRRRPAASPGSSDVTGVLAVEMFEVPATDAGSAPAYLVNELAMRPHNSGHWSMDGAVTGQFEQHLRAVLDLPLGDPRPAAPWTVMANVLGGDYDDLYRAYRHVMARDPGAQGPRLRQGGAARPQDRPRQRLRAPTSTDAAERAGHAADYLAGEITE